MILSWESSAAGPNRASALGLRGKIVLVVIVLHVTSLSLFAVMHRSLNLWSDHAHSRHNALNLNILIYQICFKTSWSDIVFAEITFEINIISCYFLWKINVRTLNSSFFRILFSCIFLQSSDNLIQLILKNFDCFNWIFGNKLTQLWIKCPNFINVDI